jgi:HPt (histidine-containing phosphotransfer) domain-containing protein
VTATQRPGEDPAARAAAAMHQIATHALKSNLARIDRLEGAVLAAGSGTLGDEERSEAAHVAHQLVGSAGTFGYSRVSRLARELEAFFQQEADPASVAASTTKIAVMQEDLQGDPDY